MFRIRKQFRFEASHRLMTSYSKACQNLHGHSYIVEIEITATGLNKDGMVIDFGELKDLVGGMINLMDHALILANGDPLLLTNCKSYIYRVPYNPTAENMALDFFCRMRPVIAVLDPAGRLVDLSVKIHETATGWAQYEGPIHLESNPLNLKEADAK